MSAVRDVELGPEGAQNKNLSPVGLEQKGAGSGSRFEVGQKPARGNVNRRNLRFPRVSHEDLGAVRKHRHGPRTLADVHRAKKLLGFCAYEAEPTGGAVGSHERLTVRSQDEKA